MYWINLIGTTIISILNIYVFNCIVSNTKLNTLFTFKKILTYIFLNILFLLNLIFFDSYNKVMLNLFITIFLNLTLIFDFNYKKSIFFSLIFFIQGLMIEILLSVLSVCLFNFNNVMYMNSSIAMFVFSIGTFICSIAIASLKKYRLLINKIYEAISEKILNFLILIFITIYVILFTFNNFKKWEASTGYYINFFMCLFVLFVASILIYNVLQKVKTEDKYNQMMEYVSKYESIINEQGKRNHEINNQLMVLSGYINDKKKLKEYLNSIIEDQRGGQNYRIKQLGFLPDGGLKGLIYYKLSKMEELKIKPFLYVSDNLKKKVGNVETDLSKDITKIFGVFVDNAIDAASKSKEKEIVIDIKIDDDNYLIILISNTYKKGSDMSKIGKKGYSTKGYGHGFGLSLVKDISKKNNKIETICEIDDKEFKQTIMVKLK